MKNNLWLIGDLHFYHKKIIEYCNRPFSDVEEMNKTLISNWNSVVKKNDEVIVAGDFALTSKDNIITIGRQLKGRKTLILGNHEGASLQTYYDAGFQIVSKYPIVIDNLQSFLMCHFLLIQTVLMSIFLLMYTMIKIIKTFLVVVFV